MAVMANTFQLDVLKKIFQKIDFSWESNTTLYVSLHTASPGASGNQTTSEASYTGYARVAVNRDNTGWTISSQTMINDDPITFGACTGGSNTITHIGIGLSSSGTGTLIIYAALTASLSVVSSPSVTPNFPAGSVVFTVT